MPTWKIFFLTPMIANTLAGDFGSKVVLSENRMKKTSLDENHLANLVWLGESIYTRHI